MSSSDLFVDNKSRWRRPPTAGDLRRGRPSLLQADEDGGMSMLQTNRRRRVACVRNGVSTLMAGRQRRRVPAKVGRETKVRTYC